MLFNNNKLLSRTLLLIVTLTLFACDNFTDYSSGDASGGSTSTATGILGSDNVVGSLSITSYNVGLALNFVPYTQERLAVNESLIANHDADIVCLQEVWLEDHASAIQDALSADYPFSYREPAEQIFFDEASCTVDEVQDFANCGNTQCPGMSGSELVSCATTNCGSHLGTLSPNCSDSVIASVGIQDITVDILFDRVTNPAGKFSYEGSTGLILASKYPLANIEFQDFIDDSTSTHRGVIYAEIELNNTTHVVGCTHLTANLSATIDYPPSGKHGSWEGENKFQLDEMISFANAKAGSNPLLLAGDFNCGLENEVQGVVAEFAGNCQAFIDQGFTDPAANGIGCTYCEQENLILLEESGDAKSGADIYIDHIYLKNLSASTISADRVFDDAIEVLALDPVQEIAAEDSPLLTHPSDHFGTYLDIVF